MIIQRRVFLAWKDEKGKVTSLVTPPTGMFLTHSNGPILLSWLSHMEGHLLILYHINCDLRLVTNRQLFAIQLEMLFKSLLIRIELIRHWKLSISMFYQLMKIVWATNIIVVVDYFDRIKPSYSSGSISKDTHPVIVLFNDYLLSLIHTVQFKIM